SKSTRRKYDGPGSSRQVRTSPEMETPGPRTASHRSINPIRSFRASRLGDARSIPSGLTSTTLAGNSPAGPRIVADTGTGSLPDGTAGLAMGHPPNHDSPESVLAPDHS